MTEQIHETVRAHYAKAAIEVLQGGACCGESTQFGRELYSALERDELPDKAVLASLGCGNPIAVAELAEGDRVLDLGSGGGLDVLLSARTRRADWPRLRPRHDRRDARAGAAQRRGGGCHQRHHPQGHHGGDPAAAEPRSMSSSATAW